MFEQLRRELTGVFAAQGMTAGLPKVKVDASQLKHLLGHYDDQVERIRALEEGIEREAADLDGEVSEEIFGGDKNLAERHREQAARLRALLEKK